MAKQTQTHLQLFPYHTAINISSQYIKQCIDLGMPLPDFQNRRLTSKHKLNLPNLGPHFQAFPLYAQTPNWLQRELCFLYKESHSLLISSLLSQPWNKPAKFGSYAFPQSSSFIALRPCAQI